MSVYKKILVPIDGSETSLRALDEAARLAQLCGARIDVLYVVDTVEDGYVPAEVYFQDVLPRLVKRGERLLKDAVDTLRAKGIQAESVLIEGWAQRVSKVIIEQASARGADLIALGTHGRRGFNRFVMGSDAEQVVRSSPVPVLLVRAAPAVAETSKAGFAEAAAG